MATDGRRRLMPVRGDPGRATFLELFFDLVFVFALTRISARTFEDLALTPGGAQGWAAVTGGGKTLLLLLALWAVWQETAWTSSRYDPHHIWLQLIVMIALVASMVMGVAIPAAFTTTGLAFAVAYVTAQVSRPLILLVALARHPYRRLKLRMLLTFATTGVLWIAGALLPNTPRVVLWTTALTLEYLAVRLGWPVPGLGRSTVSKWDIAGGHLAERYQQFFLIALGEMILVTGFTYSDGPYAMAPTVAFSLALATTIVLWRIYFQRAGLILGEAVAKARHPATFGRSAADTHLVMITGLSATAVGYELAIEHPMDRPEHVWVVMALGGPMLFLVGRARFEYNVFSRVSPSRWIGVLVLLAVAPLLLRHSLVWSSVAVLAVLSAIALDDARRAWGRPLEAPAPPH